MMPGPDVRVDDEPFQITRDIRSLLSLALFEDIGSGDITSQAAAPPIEEGVARVFAREEGVLCGVEVASAVANLVDPHISVEPLLEDGAALSDGADILRVEGPLRSILTAERVMLNFLQRLSGVATLTRRYVDALRAAGSAMQVVDTRKTTPLWRPLERHAVRVGGGVNHRFGLYDMYLVKNNHVEAAGGVVKALRRVKEHRGAKSDFKIAVEARDLDEVREIVQEGADLILLDNMTSETTREALEAVGGAIETEITGGASLERIAEIAKLPADRLSVGALTHSARALDISLHVLECRERDEQAVWNADSGVPEI